MDKIASHYELETVDHFVAVFSSIDTDGGGTLDKNEIYEALLQAGVDISEEGVSNLFNMIDEDGSGEIDQNEWKETVVFYLEIQEEEKAMSALEAEKVRDKERRRKEKLAMLGKSKSAKQRKNTPRSLRLVGKDDGETNNNDVEVCLEENSTTARRGIRFETDM